MERRVVELTKKDLVCLQKCSTAVPFF
uniref:Uncharacterized protein n=1 Tax=Anguilla anguilla TaxID=7936 RepID=A0A0E9RKF3_ANGAN